MALLDNKTIAVLATHGFEQSELERPLHGLREAGATVHVIAPEDGEIRGWSGNDWGNPVKVDRTLGDAKADDYNALVLPGGQINPDLLRVNADALHFIREFYRNGKVIAAVCHAPWLLVETGIAEGRTMTSYHSIKTDVANAGATWVDEAVVADNGIVTSRNPGDLDKFVEKIIEEVREGRHQRSAA
ncbi:DJ-1/PfpI/YhbO family deglycase/protease [Rhodobacterales bacterium HKCCE3408]|nr:DJ-1/PfpI/YhbO family deglycase/protease [Rhodobacterales bacterium HKCCE3408]